MIIVATRVKLCNAVIQFMNKVNSRLASHNIIKNPFIGQMRHVNDTLIFSVSTVYPSWFIPRIFMYWLMCKGLKKEGYIGPFKYLSKNEIIEVLLNAITK